MTENQLIEYLKRIVRLCAAHQANPNQQKREVEEIRLVAQHIIKTKKQEGKDHDVTGSPV